MPKINVYLPDALAERVRAADLPVSRICQVALAAAIDNVEQYSSTGDAVSLPEPLELATGINTYVVAFLRNAYEVARRRGAAEVGTGDLLHGLLLERDSLIHHVLSRGGFGAGPFLAQLTPRWA